MNYARQSARKLYYSFFRYRRSESRAFSIWPRVSPRRQTRRSSVDYVAERTLVRVILKLINSPTSALNDQRNQAPCTLRSGHGWYATDHGGVKHSRRKLPGCHAVPSAHQKQMFFATFARNLYYICCASHCEHAPSPRVPRTKIIARTTTVTPLAMGPPSHATGSACVKVDRWSPSAASSWGIMFGNQQAIVFGNLRTQKYFT